MRCLLDLRVARVFAVQLFKGQVSELKRRLLPRRRLRKHVPDNVAVHVRQPALDSVVGERQLFVVDAEELQNRSFLLTLIFDY